MSLKGFGLAGLVALVAVAAGARPGALGKPGLTPAPCPDQKWEESDATFEALPGAKASFGRYDGGVYRVEVPDNWNGELVLWAHGYVANAGAQGSRLRVGSPGSGQGSPFRAHLIANGYAWAASSYRCNGYVPGRGLLDTIALTDTVTKQTGKPPSRVYLTGASMGGHITVTIHNTGDLYVPVSLEQSLKRTVDSAGTSQLLVQRLMRSAGHCTFSPQEQIAAFDDLATWVRQGVRPDGDEVLGDLTNAGLKFTRPMRPGDPGTSGIGISSRR